MSGPFSSRIARLPEMFDAARAARTLETLGERAGDGQLRALIGAAASNSPYLARLLEREADNLERDLSGDPRIALASMLTSVRFDETPSRADMMRRLREVKRRASLLIALADLGGVWDLDEVTGALTRLADAALASSLRYAMIEAIGRGRFAPCDTIEPADESALFFLAMGKYGAHELNYSSDIDFSCYFNTERLPVASNVEPREFAVRLTQATVALMQEATADGYVFRCDLRLRPDAGSTQIAVSTRAAESYYETMGQNWERAAMIKARPCAGDLAEGQAFLANLAPFVWRKYLDYAAIEDIHSIKRQIHAHGGHGEVAIAGHNIKLGRGGIREIEFFAQTQQLILGGRIPSLRRSRTVEALRALAARNIIDEQTRADLAETYVFLRTLEHRLQMIEDEQTHSMPKTAEGLSNVARFMGFAETQTFTDLLRDHLMRVQSHYAKLFEGKPSLSEETGSLVFTGVDEDPETVATLRKLGFTQPEAVSATVRGWHHGRVRATRSEKAREKLTALMPLLLQALAKTANPDIAFTRFDKFLSGLPSGVQVFALLYSNPRLLGLIAEIVGTAPRLADHLAVRPGLLDVLIDVDFLRDQPTLADLTESLAPLMKGAKTFEDKLEVARRWTKDQQFRVGLQLLRGEIDGGQAGYSFADVAEAAIVALDAAVMEATASAHGRVAGGGMVVIAMGRLGGREMTAASDLDLIFVYDHAKDATGSDGGRPLAPSLYYARASQRLISALTVMTGEGGLYDVDMRLRPSGNKGPVAVSFETFAKYQADEAWTWERLALTRARVVAGPADLRARVEGVIRAALTLRRDRQQILTDVADMRGRLDRERPAKSAWDLKEAKGGLFDVEFIAQGLQLAHGVLNVNTLGALAALSGHKAVSEDDAQALAAAARLYLNVTQVLRLTVDGPFNAADASASLQALVARVAGFGLFDDVERALNGIELDVRLRFARLIAPVPA
ncbi:MAG: bifunctional [glutamine synthetase] adenylyltransferase/[glutamine synthetase]-adenylyl-L-tyrosine phosphorylase [Alphaproteobacteria bacterium]|nr:bifunctional [glutamine synthetase] adenylyltransferase/[glutamine synthetase]-adenylyl-L-tyrosine phosphorylase [Alphaproteobacteria bacterium]